MDTEALTELTQQAVRKEAAIWLARIDRGLRNDEVATLRAWLGSAPHRECIVTTARLWHGPETVSVLSALFPVAAEPAKHEPGRPFPAILVTTLIAVAVVTVVTLTINSTFHDAVTPASPDRIHTTDATHTREVRLTDGSLIQLNRDSGIRVTYGPAMREIKLLRGEAQFLVTPDAARPFEVYVGAQAFESMGGAFAIRAGAPGEIALIVTAGEVRVMRSLAPGHDSRRTPPPYIKVRPFEAVQLKPGLHTVRQISPAEADAALAWQSLGAQ